MHPLKLNVFVFFSELCGQANTNFFFLMNKNAHEKESFVEWLDIDLA